MDRGAAKRSVKNVGAGLVPVIPRSKAAPSATKTASDHSMADQLSLTVRAGMPLSQLNIALLDTDTKLILAEKEQALLGNTRYIFLTTRQPPNCMSIVKEKRPIFGQHKSPRLLPIITGKLTFALFIIQVK